MLERRGEVRRVDMGWDLEEAAVPQAPEVLGGTDATGNDGDLAFEKPADWKFMAREVAERRAEVRRSQWSITASRMLGKVCGSMMQPRRGALPPVRWVADMVADQMDRR